MRAFVWALVVRAPGHRLMQLTSGTSVVLHTAADSLSKAGSCFTRAFGEDVSRSILQRLKYMYAMPSLDAFHDFKGGEGWDKQVQATSVGL